MSVYRRFARSKKGMSTVFGALFFVILILMGFNVMLWSFQQFDGYNQIITSTGFRDQQARSELLAFNPPGAYGFKGNSFNITVSNQGGTAVTVSRIYITNLSPTNSFQCQGVTLCIVNPAPSVVSFTNGVIQTGELNHVIAVSGMTIGDGSGYKVVLSTTRGRQFSFFYPWPVNVGGGGGASNSNSTNTAHGALDVKFDINSFNFTRGSQTVSQPGWTVPYNTEVVWWVKVVNNAINPIVLSQYTSLYFVCYQDMFGSSQGACTQTDDTFIVDTSTLNPNSVVPYNEVNRPYVLPAATPNGPSGSTIVKFADNCPGLNANQNNGVCGPGSPSINDVDYPTPYLVFMGFFYKINGQLVGQTISFVAIRACSTYPSCP